jgi:anti-sigma regulatory factor (Ser/Thr protein kinase)
MQAANTQARRERTTMTIAAAETTPLIAFTLPSTPYSVQMARFYVRAALSYHDLGDYAEDAEMVASELVTNAITHAGARAVGLEVTCMQGAGTLAIVVTDPCPLPPVKRDPVDGAEHGRGLHLVEALSARWGWRLQDPGKAVFAILTREA